MTIALGFWCMDGVVLCADRQYTNPGGFKYQDRKIAYGEFGKHIEGWGLRKLTWAWTFAGDPDEAEVFGARVSRALGECEFRRDPHRECEEILLSALRDESVKPDQTLHAFWVKRPSFWGLPFMFRTVGKKAMSASREFLGVGDSSVIRYLDECLGAKKLTVAQAEVLGAYLVSVANRFIDGCEGGPDVLTLRAGGELSQQFPFKTKKIPGLEKRLGRTMRKALGISS